MTKKIKVYLDDVRDTPEGYVRCYWPYEVVKLLRQGNVELISLDHDLGDDKRGTGYNVMLWLEESVMSGEWSENGRILPIIKIHSMNPIGVQKMEFVANRVKQYCIDNGIPVHTTPEIAYTHSQ